MVYSKRATKFPFASKYSRGCPPPPLYSKQSSPLAFLTTVPLLVVRLFTPFAKHETASVVDVVWTQACPVRGQGTPRSTMQAGKHEPPPSVESAAGPGDPRSTWTSL